ncbi:MOSC domain-containing protein [Rhodococcus sp. HNM0569]|uniref:MOSC domain-containing protein n=1 Tax=Rhodococcus sp. HNM0569 TaxID=2716340 RepID=UPI00146DA57E|nr:MOSC domain-containing protein [Rhodococcus sp. HNM0569]NLU82350.1 MOSC domain-containing protein [Rhodococcus sp. HNM0569]
MSLLGTVTAVCVLFAERDSGVRRVPRTAIDKRPVAGPVDVHITGLAGDKVCDVEFHGGASKAVYAYAKGEADRWAAELGRDLPAGWFGENLRVDGFSPTDAVLGERWRVGECELEITSPRTPCATFGNWSGEPRWVRRFTERADTGAYLAVRREGRVRAGDRVELLERPAHGVTVRDVFAGTDPDVLARLRASGAPLADSTIERIDYHLARHDAQVRGTEARS